MQKNMKKPVLRIRIYQYPDPGSKKCPYGPGSYGIKQCCGAGAASFRAGANFFLVGAGSRSRSFIFNAAPAPAASFRQAKKKSLVLVSNMTLRAV